MLFRPCRYRVRKLSKVIDVINNIISLLGIHTITLSLDPFIAHR